MECMICFTETNSIYKMKGCSHTICTSCSVKMYDMPSSIAYPFSNLFTMNELITRCLRCPYCRQQEPMEGNLQSLSFTAFKVDYYHQFKTQMNDLYPSRYNTCEMVNAFCDKYNSKINHLYAHYESKLRNSYKLWMDLELRFDGETSTICMKYKRYLGGKKKNIYKLWMVEPGDISVDDFISSNVNYKHRKHVSIKNRPNLKIKDVRRMKR